MSRRSWAEPFKIKVVEHLRMTTREERERAIPRAQFPGQAVVCALYRIGGVRGVEIGSAMFGDRPPAGLELVRLAMPRRVYTQSHMDCVVEGCAALAARRGSLRGLRMVHEPPVLRHFTARFEEM